MDPKADDLIEGEDNKNTTSSLNFKKRLIFLILGPIVLFILIFIFQNCEESVVSSINTEHSESSTTTTTTSNNKDDSNKTPSMPHFSVNFS